MPDFLRQVLVILYELVFPTELWVETGNNNIKGMLVNGHGYRSDRLQRDYSAVRINLPL